MGLCCTGGAKTFSDVKDKPVSKEDGDLTEGPVKARGCTDILCLLLFVGALILYLICVFFGWKDGYPPKLYVPRDYAGVYCGVEKQWNGGPSMKNAPLMMYTMNVTAIVDPVAQQLACSSAADDYLSGALTQDDYTEYECSCCFRPCANYSCPGALKAKDLDLGSVQTVISGKMSELLGGGSGLFSPTSLNGNLFESALKEATKYFNMVCTNSCDSYSKINESTRTYTYKPAPDDKLSVAWEKLMGTGAPSAIRDTIQGKFTFRALPEGACPYASTSKCVPMPGITFQKIASVCQFMIDGSALSGVGSAGAEALTGLANSDFSKQSEDTFGSWVGEISQAMGGIIVTCVCSFIIAFLFLILLRFFVGVIVWCSIFLVFVLLCVSGGVLWIRSWQCTGTTITQSSQATANAAASAANALAKAAIAGNGNPLAEEKLSGDGSDYRGYQTKTMSGYTCQDWDCMTTSSCDNNQSTFTSTAFPDAGLIDNRCRNPGGSTYKSYTIWCYTTDPLVKWETCLPIGVLRPTCINGYEVEGESARLGLRIIGFVMWAFAVFWFILICCLCSRIRLAIALNKVGAMFVYETPFVLLVPIVEAIIGIAWIVLWAISAAYLISQVPEGFTPTKAFATYAEAYGYYKSDGKTWVVGECLGSWPQGVAWKDNDNCDLSGPEPKCWRCYPPRFILDWRFWYNLFFFFWVNAFGLAIAQCTIAGAVGIWFFTKHDEKRSVAKVCRAVRNTFIYHLGSLAFGSLILAIVQTIRYYMMYLEKQAQAQKNKVMVMVFKVIQCCLWCLEKCIKFLNKNAYIQVALMGTNFCTSAKVAFGIILRNFIRFGVVAGLSSITDFIGVAVITVCTTFVGYFIIKGMHPHSNVIILLFFFVAIGYVVSKLFMSVFMLAIDTSLQAFIITEEYGGEPVGGEYVPGPLKELLPSKE